MENINRMFYLCDSLKSIDLSNFKCERVTNASFLFYCSSILEKITFINNNLYFNTGNVTDMSYMFACCNKLKDLYILYVWWLRILIKFRFIKF